MKSVKIVAALVVGSVLLASECQCDTTDEPADPVEEMVLMPYSEPSSC